MKKSCGIQLRLFAI